MGKVQVGPLKPIAFPRIELRAVEVATRMDQMLQEELEIPLEPSVLR